jgi:hypothetical protein
MPLNSFRFLSGLIPLVSAHVCMCGTQSIAGKLNDFPSSPPQGPPRPCLGIVRLIFSPMPLDLPFNVYWEHLSLAALSHAIALWNPSPPGDIYDKVSIGDVGYLHEVTVTGICTFNVMLHGTIRRTQFFSTTLITTPGTETMPDSYE